MPLTEKERYKKYAKTEKGKMNRKKHQWLHNNVKFEDELQFITIYYHWLVSTHCEKCNIKFTEGNTRFKKCLDHDHNTGLYRNILCHVCNVNDMTTNTSNIPNISWYNKDKKWVYAKVIDGKNHRKRFILKEEAIEYKKQYESN